MSCLIIKNDGLGDLILASGLIADLAVHFGGADLITCEANREIAESIPGAIRCLYVSRDDLRFRSRPSRWGIFLPVARGSDNTVLTEMAGIHYDVAICLRRFIRESSLVLMRAVRAKKKHCAWQFPTNVGLATARRATKGWAHFDGNQKDLSELIYYRSFLKHATGVEFRGKPRLRMAERRREMAQGKRVGLGIGARSSVWPVEHWVGLVRALCADDWDITLFGGTDCAGIDRIIRSAFPQCKSCVGTMSLAATAEQLSDFDAFVANDTGLMHLASLVVPICLILQGGGTFQRFFPWPDASNQYQIFHAHECFDCNWQCVLPNQDCLNFIRPSGVAGYLRRIISGHSSQKYHNENRNSVSYRLAWRYTDGETAVNLEGGV
jgi:ADP-heptose:LPS heptosyltransferase